MADGQPGSADLTEWAPNPRAAEIGTGVWTSFCNEFVKESSSGYHVFRRDCYKVALTGDELAVKQWKAWEQYLAEARLMGEV